MPNITPRGIQSTHKRLELFKYTCPDDRGARWTPQSGKNHVALAPKQARFNSSFGASAIKLPSALKLTLALGLQFYCVDSFGADQIQDETIRAKDGAVDTTAVDRRRRSEIVPAYGTSKALYYHCDATLARRVQCDF